jgi:hypothetical protein
MTDAVVGISRVRDRRVIAEATKPIPPPALSHWEVYENRRRQEGEAKHAAEKKYAEECRARDRARAEQKRKAEADKAVHAFENSLILDVLDDLDDDEAKQVSDIVTMQYRAGARDPAVWELAKNQWRREQEASRQFMKMPVTRTAEMSDAELAAELGCTPSYVKQLKKENY